MIDRSNGCNALAALKATEASSLLGMEGWNPVVNAGVNLIECSPIKTLLFWICALGDVNRNRLATLGKIPW